MKQEAAGVFPYKKAAERGKPFGFVQIISKNEEIGKKSYSVFMGKFEFPFGNYLKFGRRVSQEKDLLFEENKLYI